MSSRRGVELAVPASGFVFAGAAAGFAASLGVTADPRGPHAARSRITAVADSPRMGRGRQSEPPATARGEVGCRRRVEQRLVMPGRQEHSSGHGAVDAIPTTSGQVPRPPGRRVPRSRKVTSRACATVRRLEPSGPRPVPCCGITEDQLLQRQPRPARRDADLHRCRPPGRPVAIAPWSAPQLAAC